jgi:hypothetical protein
MIAHSRLGFLVALVLLLSGCFDPCGNTVIQQIKAPDGLHTAIMFQRDCGATTSFSTQISILGSGTALSGSGNTFTADDDHGAAKVGGWGGPWTDMKWIAPNHLLVRYARNTRVFKHKPQVSGVSVSYQRLN